MTRSKIPLKLKVEFTKLYTTHFLLLRTKGLTKGTTSAALPNLPEYPYGVYPISMIAGLFHSRSRLPRLFGGDVISLPANSFRNLCRWDIREALRKLSMQFNDIHIFPIMRCKRSVNCVFSGISGSWASCSVSLLVSSGISGVAESSPADLSWRSNCSVSSKDSIYIFRAR